MVIESPASTPSPSPDGEVIVLAGGDAVDAAFDRDLPHPATVIAADSGLALAAVLGLRVDLLVGDLDSVDRGQLATARSSGVEVVQYPVDKDRTDLAIAMAAAMSRTPSRITVVGGHGGRLDHLLGNVSLLASDEFADVTVVAHMGAATVTVVRGQRLGGSVEVSGDPGDVISLIPMHGDARGVRTEGLRFALDGHDLPAGSSQGVSNVFTGHRATVALRAGVLLVVQPGDIPTTKR